MPKPLSPKPRNLQATATPRSKNRAGMTLAPVGLTGPGMPDQCQVFGVFQGLGFRSRIWVEDLWVQGSGVEGASGVAAKCFSLKLC